MFYRAVFCLCSCAFSCIFRHVLYVHFLYVRAILSLLWAYLTKIKRTNERTNELHEQYERYQAHRSLGTAAVARTAIKRNLRKSIAYLY